MRILFISRWFPYPPNNGSKLRIFHLLRGLTADHQVTLLSFYEPGENIDRNAPELQSLFESVQLVPWSPFVPSSWKARLAFINRKPRSVIDSNSPEMAARVQALADTQAFDLVIASQVGAAEYGRIFRETPSLFEEVELAFFLDEFHQAASWPRRLRAALTLEKQKRYLRRVLNAYNACTVVSEAEKVLLHKTIPGLQDVVVIPNSLELSEYQGVNVQRRPNSIIFTGSFNYAPNYEAMLWFLERVNPRLQADPLSPELVITGDPAGRSLPAAANVRQTGYVDDIKSLVASSSISIAPIFSGGGTRLKILEAMALRTPVVATSKGAEGLDVEHGTHLLIADTPQEFADAVLRLLRDPELRASLSGSAYELLAREYSWDVVGDEFQALINRVSRRPG
jgi:glycosyltransferase involved in cell wall biosynthesis